MRFEEYLDDIHYEQYDGKVEYIETAFEDWLLELGVQEWIDLAQDYGSMLQKELIQEQTNEALDRLKQAMKERGEEENDN